MPTVFFTVTNDLVYDQRMIRICSSLAKTGYNITLVGRKMKNSPGLQEQAFKQKRLTCFFEKGFAFYAEYNLRLFFFLLLNKMDGCCAIDLDTILPVFVISKLKKVKRIYDAHEFFCEMKEVVSRPGIYACWKWIERKTLPHFVHAYTVNDFLARKFENLYQHHYEVIRNMPVYNNLPPENGRENYILYQGAVNEGRSFETLIPAMQWIPVPLVICGDGNYMAKAKKLVKELSLDDKIIFKGMLLPQQLKHYTRKALLGIALVENHGENNYYSLANRFFDYIHAGLPQLCVDFPVYKEINEKYEVAFLINDLSSRNIAAAVNGLLAGKEQWQKLHHNCLQAAKILNWQEEEKKLLSFYNRIFE